jgi:hypothetical protein
MDVLDILIDQVKETHLYRVVNYGQQEKDNKDHIGSISKVLDRLRNELLIDSESENV